MSSISERMGHSSVRTTLDIYAHAMRGKDDGAAKAWSAAQERDHTQKSKGVN
jgi:integrase